MTWTGVLLALLISHMVGDVLLQTDWQAVNKTRSPREQEGRRALLQHVTVYTVAFVPALVWIGAHATVGRVIVVGAVVAIPHLLIDDGTIVRAWVRHVKGAARPSLGLLIAVDQSFHVLCLLGAALIAVA